MKRGRPKINDSVVLIRLPGHLHNDLCADARQNDKTISEVIRERLAAKRISTNRQELKTA
jgi:hypothetical protein